MQFLLVKIFEQVPMSGKSALQFSFQLLAWYCFHFWLGNMQVGSTTNHFASTCVFVFVFVNIIMIFFIKKKNFNWLFSC